MADRFRIRRSTTKATPAPTDLMDGELGYSFVSGNFFIKNPQTGAIDTIGGKSQMDSLAQVNRLPVVSNDVLSILDDVQNATGNVLSNDSDPEGGTLVVSSIKYSSIPRTLGASFGTTYGTMNMSANGTWSFSTNATANALNIGQSVSEQFTYVTTDIAGGSTTGTLTVNITGKNSQPVANQDTIVTDIPVNTSGNVLSNDTDPEGQMLSVSGWTVNGVAGNFVPGQTVSVPGFGSITLNSNGSWSRDSTGATNSGTIIVTYNVTDGTNTSQGTLAIIVQPELINIDSNPVTVALSGTRTFDVGPGKTYTEVNDIPWSSLTAGDVVNIFWRSTPYKTKFGLCAQGTANAPIIINGVTDSNGNRPVIDGNGATNSPGSMPGGSGNIWAVGDEGFGVITIKRKPQTSTSTNPSWITIQNLEITGGLAANNYISSTGTTVPYGFSAGIWVQPSTDITIRNNVIHGCSQGLFTMAKAAADGSSAESCQRIRVLYNRIYGNGTPGSGYEHGCYIQAYDVVVEGNYLGRGLTGAGGSTYKSRVGKEVIRYNWIESTARALDMVHVEFSDGFAAYPDYGIDYVYGNVIVNDEQLQGNAWRPIHYGADGSTNGGEWDPAYGGSAPPNHRKHLYFFSNTYFHRNTVAQADQFVIQLSWPETICDAWANIFLLRGANSQLNLMYLAGQLNLRGSNIILGYGTINDYSAGRGGTTQSCQVNRMGSVIASDPLFTAENYYDFSLAAGSPAIDIYSGLPSGISSQIGIDHAVKGQPFRQLNGLTLRPLNIGTTDLGALERDPSAPPRSAPIKTTDAIFNVNNVYVVGSTISVSDPAWLYNPTTVTRQYQNNISGTWTDIPGATNSTYTLTSNDTGGIRVRYVATNAAGSTEYITSSYAVTSTPAVSIIQIASAVDPYPSSLKTAVATMTTQPVVGNTLVAFLSEGSSIGDNFGNAWVKRQDIASGKGWNFQLYTCVVSTTGSNFQITGVSPNSWSAGLVVYEVAGAYVTSVAEASATGDIDDTVTINATAPNQRIIAGFACGQDWGTNSITVAAPWVAGVIFDRTQLLPLLSVVHGVSYAAGPNNVTADFGNSDYRLKLAVVLA